MKSVICPFCGVVGEAPHETQEACIEALQAEIAHTRRVLDKVTEPTARHSVADEQDPQLT
jgi:hypothetical protein